MRGPLNPEQLLSPGVLKSANTLLTVCLAALSVMGLLHAIGHLFLWRPFTALLVASMALAIPLALWMIVRLLSEALAAQQSLNDRITLLNETLMEPEHEEIWEEVDVSQEEDISDEAEELEDIKKAGDTPAETSSESKSSDDDTSEDPAKS